MNNTLALKYRPKTFEEVKGIDSIVDILRNQVDTNTTRGSYIFCGESGNGKTTLSRIFAEEINKSKQNIVELNMSDKTGIDDIRAIIDEARKRPIGTEYKIYILDEVHQITTQSQNALLKILEETPKHVKFILCTTNPEKLLPTIQNRCQRFDFPKQDIDTIVEQLEFIIEKENTENFPSELEGTWEKIRYTKESLEKIAEHSRGSFRSAISHLDKVLSLTHNITLEDVENTIGMINDTIFDDMLDYIIEQDHLELTNLIRATIDKGVNLRDFVVQALKYTIDEYLGLKKRDEIYLDIIEVLSNLNGDLALANYTTEYVIAKLLLI